MSVAKALTPVLKPEDRVFILQCLQNKVISLEEARDILFIQK